MRLELDDRDIDFKRRDGMIASIEGSCDHIAIKRNLRITMEVLNADAPARCDPLVVEAVTPACQKSSQTFAPLVSRAYHDSLFLSRIAPTGMIFIPCRNGLSHHPDEYTSPENIEAGVIVLASKLAELAS